MNKTYILGLVISLLLLSTSSVFAVGGGEIMFGEGDYSEQEVGGGEIFSGEQPSVIVDKQDSEIILDAKARIEEARAEKYAENISNSDSASSDKSVIKLPKAGIEYVVVLSFVMAMAIKLLFFRKKQN